MGSMGLKKNQNFVSGLFETFLLIHFEEKIRKFTYWHFYYCNSRVMSTQCL